MAGTVTTGIMPPAVRESFNQKIMAVEIPDYIHTLVAGRETNKRYSGDIVVFRRHNPLPASPVPVGNSGSDIAYTTPTNVDIKATLQLYGQVMKLNEQVTLMNNDRVLNIETLRMGEALKLTEDILARDLLVSTTSVINATNGSNGDSITEMTKQDIGKVVRALKTNNAKPLFKHIEGANKFGTAPVRQSYLAMAHTELINDFDEIDGFTYVSNYPSQENVPESEWGAVGNLRFVLSSEGSVSEGASGLAADVYNIPCTGVDSYGLVKQDGMEEHFIYKPPMYVDDLNQNCILGWKMMQAGAIYNDAWVINFRCTRG